MLFVDGESRRQLRELIRLSESRPLGDQLVLTVVDLTNKINVFVKDFAMLGPTAGVDVRWRLKASGKGFERFRLHLESLSGSERYPAVAEEPSVELAVTGNLGRDAYQLTLKFAYAAFQAPPETVPYSLEQLPGSIPVA